MKGKLYKESEGYYLLVSNKTIGTTRPLLNFDIIEYKLSLENCQAIERGYDLDELLKKEIANGKLHPNDGAKKEGIERGIQIALEIFGDKKFSEEDLMEAYSRGQTNSPIQSLQQTEWDVEFEMEYVGECNGNNDNGCFQDSPGHNCGCFKRKPKLDATGCLILKKYKNG